jgi:hypothetical protein
MKPVFLFGRRGQPLSAAATADTFARIQTSNHNDFVNWVWKQIEITVTFVNNHQHRVEAYWINSGRARYYFALEPGETNTQTSMLSHEWWFRDARVDMFPDAPKKQSFVEGMSRSSIWNASSVCFQQSRPKTTFYSGY